MSSSQEILHDKKLRMAPRKCRPEAGPWLTASKQMNGGLFSCGHGAVGSANDPRELGSGPFRGQASMEAEALAHSWIAMRQASGTEDPAKLCLN